MPAHLLQVGLLQEDKVDPEEVARQHTIDWLNRCAQQSDGSGPRAGSPHGLHVVKAHMLPQELSATPGCAPV